MKPSHLLKSTLTYGFGQILSRSLTLLLLPFFTHYLTAEDYGIISLLNIGILFATSFLTLGLGTAYCLCYSDPCLDKQRVLATGFGMVASLSFLYIILIWSLAPGISLFFFFDPSYADLVCLSLITTVAASLCMPLNLHLQLTHQAATISIITFAFTLITIGLNALAIASFELGIRGQALATSVSSLLLLVMYVWATRSHLTCYFSWEIAKKLLKMGLPMIPASFALFFLQQNPRYFLDRYTSLEELGLYSVAFNIALAASLIVSAFSQAWTPFFLEFTSKKEEAKTLFGTVFTYYTHASMLVILAFFVFANPLVQLMTTPPFFPSAKCIGTLAIGWILVGYYNLMNTGIVFAKKIYLNTVIQLITALASLICSLLIIPIYGMMGAAIVFTFSHLLMLIIEEVFNHYFGFFRLSIVGKDILPIVTTGMLFIVITKILSFSSLLDELLWGFLSLMILSQVSYFTLIRLRHPANKTLSI